jgi:predicted transcriptional regulator of viral defense system
MDRSVEKLFMEHGGQLRMSEALAGGMSRYMLYHLRDKGVVKPIARGVYRLANLPAVSDPDLLAVSLRYPHAVLCLLSALSFHEITTEIPSRIYIALPRTSRIPTLKHPPLSVHRFSGAAYSEGIETRSMADISVKVYCIEKTIADCFKFRNQIGMDVVLEAFKLYRERHRFDGNKIMHYARICRVEEVMRPYLEASL